MSRALSAAIRGNLYSTKCFEITPVCLPFPTHVLLTTGRMLFPANVVYFSICFFYSRSLSPATRTADGGITTDSILILNTMKHRSCILLNGSKDIKMEWFHFVSTLNPDRSWIEYFCTCAKRCPFFVIYTCSADWPFIFLFYTCSADCHKYSSFIIHHIKDNTICT